MAKTEAEAKPLVQSWTDLDNRKGRTMSLDFDTSKVAHELVRAKDGSMTGLAQTMIFMSMFVDLGEITEKNVKQFYKRAFLFEHSCGALRQTDKGELFVTEEEVRSFIGLKTNVANKTEAQWQRAHAKRLMDRLLEKWHREFRTPEGSGA